MSTVVRISDELFKHLQDEARALDAPFASPDNVLRAVLGMEQIGPKQVSAKNIEAYDKTRR